MNENYLMDRLDYLKDKQSFVKEHIRELRKNNKFSKADELRENVLQPLSTKIEQYNNQLQDL